MATVAVRVAGSHKGAAVGRKKTAPKKDALPIAVEFGKHLNALLAEKRLTVAEFVTRLASAGCPRSDVSVWRFIRGESTPPMVDLPAMAKALGLKRWQDLIPPPKK